MDAITLNWPGGEHMFALRLGELRRMQEACGAGPEEILQRLTAGAWRVDDIIEPIRLGLIGGGYPQKDAGLLVTRMMEQNPLHVFKLQAMAIVAHSLFGPEDDRPEKSQGETPPSENGDLPTSTEPEPS